MKKTLALVMAVILIGLASAAYAIVDKPGTTSQQDVMVVKNSNGESVGTVTNALVDSSGNIAFIIVAIEQESMEGTKEIVVPSSIFAYDARSKTLLLNMTQDQLAAAPEFNLSDLNDPSYASRIYRSYGLVPPWSDEGTTEGETE